MVLRVLWLKENKPNSKLRHFSFGVRHNIVCEAWRELDMLMDHLEEGSLTKRKNSIVDFIRNQCKLRQFSEKEIRHVIGVLDTNAYIICENPNKETERSIDESY